MHALSATYGINANDRHFNDVQTAYNNNTTIDTATLDYGFFPNAEAEGVAILNGVLRNANQVYNSTVTGGATVAATGIGQIPALYAQAYSNAAGYQSVVITNKSATAHTVTIERNGTAVGGTLPMQFITGTDPSTQNTSTTDSPITIQSSTSTNPVPVPAYSVVRVDLTGGITIQTNPPGLPFTVDTQPVFTAPQFLSLAPGSHSISVAPTQAGAPGTQYVFANWSDGGTPSHNITVGDMPATYTANFTPQYLLTATVSPSGAGNVAPSGAYYNAGAEIAVTATGTPPYAFSSWSGGASGSTNPVQVIMNTPKSVTAQFVNTEASCEINGQGLPNVADVQIVINEALGDLPALNDLNGDGVVNVIDVQIEVNAALNRGCSATSQ
jgi:hypothetical protein